MPQAQLHTDCRRYPLGAPPAAQVGRRRGVLIADVPSCVQSRRQVRGRRAQVGDRRTAREAGCTRPAERLTAGRARVADAPELEFVIRRAVAGQLGGLQVHLRLQLCPGDRPTAVGDEAPDTARPGRLVEPGHPVLDDQAADPVVSDTVDRSESMLQLGQGPVTQVVEAVDAGGHVLGHRRTAFRGQTERLQVGRLGRRRNRVSVDVAQVERGCVVVRAGVDDVGRRPVRGGRVPDPPDPARTVRPVPQELTAERLDRARLGELGRSAGDRPAPAAAQLGAGRDERGGHLQLVRVRQRLRHGPQACVGCRRGVLGRGRGDVEATLDHLPHLGLVDGQRAVQHLVELAGIELQVELHEVVGTCVRVVADREHETVGREDPAALAAQRPVQDVRGQGVRRLAFLQRLVELLAQPGQVGEPAGREAVVLYVLGRESRRGRLLVRPNLPYGGLCIAVWGQRAVRLGGGAGLIRGGCAEARDLGMAVGNPEPRDRPNTEPAGTLTRGCVLRAGLVVGRSEQLRRLVAGVCRAGGSDVGALRVIRCCGLEIGDLPPYTGLEAFLRSGRRRLLGLGYDDVQTGPRRPRSGVPAVADRFGQVGQVGLDLGERADAQTGSGVPPLHTEPAELLVLRLRSTIPYRAVRPGARPDVAHEPADRAEESTRRCTPRTAARLVHAPDRAPRTARRPQRPGSGRLGQALGVAGQGAGVGDQVRREGPVRTLLPGPRAGQPPKVGLALEPVAVQQVLQQSLRLALLHCRQPGEIKQSIEPSGRTVRRTPAARPLELGPDERHRFGDQTIVADHRRSPGKPALQPAKSLAGQSFTRVPQPKAAGLQRERLGRHDADREPERLARANPRFVLRAGSTRQRQSPRSDHRTGRLATSCSVSRYKSHWTG